MVRTGKYLLAISLLLVATAAQAQVSQKPLPGQDLNNTWTGTNTHSGTETFNNFIQLSGGTCSVAGLQAAIATVVTGTVDARSCITISTNITNATSSIVIPKNVTVLLGPSTWTCTITTASTPCWSGTGNGAKLIGAGAGVAKAGGVDPLNADASGITNLLCSACGTTTDMVYFASSDRTTGDKEILGGTEISGLWINLGNSGRDAIHIVTPNATYIHDNSAYNFPGSGLHWEAALTGDIATNSYRNTFGRMELQPPSGNITGAAFYVDARNSEAGFSTITAVRGSGNTATGGGLVSLLMQAASINNASIDNITVSNSYFANPTCAAGSFGVKMMGSGTYNAGTFVGTLNNLHFDNDLFERLFACATGGTAIGGTNGSSVPGGAALGDNTFSSIQGSANWPTAIFDTANLGERASGIASGPAATPRPAFQCWGQSSGNNSACLNDTGTRIALNNNDSLFGMSLTPTFNDNGKTGVTHIVYYGVGAPSWFDSIQWTGAGTGNLGVGTQPWANLFLGTAATNNFKFQPAATAAARIISIPDPLAAENLALIDAITANFIPKAASSSTSRLSPSLESDDGTTMTYTGTGGYSAPRLTSTVSTGTAPLTVTSTTAVANLKVQNLSAVSGGDLPSAAGGTDVGSTALPYGNLWLGTAATNNFKLQPAATSGARILTMADPLSPTTVALPMTIGNGTAAMTTAAVAGGACGTTVTVAATGVLTTDTIDVSHSAAATAANGGLLVLNWWPTAGNVNFNYCNPGTVSNTPTAMTLNWSVRRP